MLVVYGYKIFARGYDHGDALDQILDAIRDEEGIPRGEWNPADPEASLANLGLRILDIGDEEDVDEFVLTAVPIEVQDGDPEVLPPPDLPWLDWAFKRLKLPEDAEVDGPRWMDVDEFGA